MANLWILATLIGAIAQTGRNATQAGLTKAIGTVGATQVRFLFGLPFALVFLALLPWLTGDAVPALTLRTIGFTLMGALAQIAGTALMLQTMKSQAFGVTTAWLKSEPVLVAVIGALILGDHLASGGWAAIGVAMAGVMILTLKPGIGRAMFRETGPAALGILAGLMFGIAAISFRGGIVNLASGGFLIRATTTLALALTIQTATLLIWMALMDRTALRASFLVWRMSLTAGFLGAFASECWFIGFSLTSAANVRTLALVEVILAQLVSYYMFRQTVNRRQLVGMAVILAGVALLLHG